MPSTHTEPNLAALACAREPGNTKINISEKEPNRVSKWQALFHFLPNELHVNIAAHLDPVSQMCLGLTSRRFHNIFHEFMDVVCKHHGERKYNINKRPFDLRMRTSVHEEHVLYGWSEFWFLQDAEDILWEDRNLGDLIAGEKSLFRGLERCEGCLKYKPRSAYARFGFEVEMAGKHHHEIDILNESDLIHYSTQCRRCRVWVLMVLLEKRAEYFEEPECPLEEKKSLGLLTREKEEVDEEKDKISDFNIAIFKKQDEVSLLTLNPDYEPWADIFAKLQI